MLLALIVGVVGTAGAVARYLVDGAVQDRTSGLFPFGTLTVNVAGSLVFGLVAGIALRHSGAEHVETIVGTGFCGAFTTWSTASWETVRLAQEGEAKAAVGFTLANLALSLAAGAIGLAATVWT
jgi:CrcB protein